MFDIDLGGRYYGLYTFSCRHWHFLV